MLFSNNIILLNDKNIIDILMIDQWIKFPLTCMPLNIEWKNGQLENNAQLSTFISVYPLTVVKHSLMFVFL